MAGIEARLRPVTIAGIIDEVRAISTKNNDRMAFIKITDLTGTIEAAVFPKLYATAADIVVPDTCIVVQAKVTERNGDLSLAIDSIKKI